VDNAPEDISLEAFELTDAEDVNVAFPDCDDATE
jgi:hypothetical protein